MLCLHWSTTPCTPKVRKLLIGFDDNTVNDSNQSLFPCLQENHVFAKRFLLCIMTLSKLGGHTKHSWRSPTEDIKKALFCWFDLTAQEMPTYNPHCTQASRRVKSWWWSSKTTGSIPCTCTIRQQAIAVVSYHFSTIWTTSGTVNVSSAATCQNSCKHVNSAVSSVATCQLGCNMSAQLRPVTSDETCHLSCIMLAEL